MQDFVKWDLYKVHDVTCNAFFKIKSSSTCQISIDYEVHVYIYM